jgi:transmembrane sensor
MAGNGFDREILKRYFNGKFSVEDELYVYELFGNAMIEKELRNYLSDHFNEIFSDDRTDKRGMDHILRRIHYNINTGNQLKSRNKFIQPLTWVIRIAGVIILAVSVFWGIKGYTSYNNAKDTYVSIQAPAWTRAQFFLPDGTTGWLNSNSGLSYSMAFNDDRKVKLNGEAYFDVIKDKTPFVVTTGDISVKVLGTRFNIAAYDNEDNVEIVLEEGKIELTGNESQNSLTMVPDQLVVFDKIRNGLIAETVETKKYLSWTEGKLVFRNDPLEVVARRLERWYNVDVEVNGVVGEDFRLRATFVDENLEEVLEILEHSLGIEYRVENPDQKPDDTYAKKKILITVRN